MPTATYQPAVNRTASAENPLCRVVGAGLPVPVVTG